MRIGFVTTWLQRGATYVTLNYIKLLQREHNLFIYARGGEYFDPDFQVEGVTIQKGLRLGGTEIDEKDFFQWIENNQIEIVILNEQSALQAVCALKLKLPHVKIGAYIDYYKENNVADFKIYDFLICNTKRHYSVFCWHKQCLYLPWGVDTEVYRVSERANEDDELRFFHSMGMSNRKGTEILIKTFYENGLGRLNAKLIIHTQLDITNILPADYREHNIEVIHRSVSAPGLYHLGDVYVYPCKLDGLGLTMYEALSCGLPIIATDVAPMNEIVTDQVGKLVSVKNFHCRADGYYWPLSIVDEDSLLKAMLYYIENREELSQEKKKARECAETCWKWSDRAPILLEFIKNIQLLSTGVECERVLKRLKNEKKSSKLHFWVDLVLPKKIQSKIREKRENRRK